MEELECGAERENALLRMDALLRSFGKEDSRKRNPRSTSIPKDPDIQHTETFRWLVSYFPEQSPGAGVAPCVRVWMGRLEDRDIVILKRELEGGTFRPNGAGAAAWSELSRDQQKFYMTAGLNAMLRMR